MSITWNGNRARGRHTVAVVSKGSRGWLYTVSQGFGGGHVLDTDGTLYKNDAKHMAEEAMRRWDSEIDAQGGPTAWRSGGRRNRTGPLTTKQIMALRPGLDFFGASDRSMRMEDLFVRAFVRKHGEEAFEVQLPLANPRQRKHFAIVSREVVAGPYFGHWRVTYFDQRGPIGHGYGGAFERKRNGDSEYQGILRRLISDRADWSKVRFA